MDVGEENMVLWASASGQGCQEIGPSAEMAFGFLRSTPFHYDPTSIQFLNKQQSIL